MRNDLPAKISTFCRVHLASVCVRVCTHSVICCTCLQLNHSSQTYQVASNQPHRTARLQISVSFMHSQVSCRTNKSVQLLSLGCYRKTNEAWGTPNSSSTTRTNYNNISLHHTCMDTHNIIMSRSVGVS